MMKTMYYVSEFLIFTDIFHLRYLPHACFCTMWMCDCRRCYCDKFYLDHYRCHTDFRHVQADMCSWFAFKANYICIVI